MTDDLYAARRKKLEQALIDAALELSRFTNTAGHLIPIPDTSPQLYVVLGTKETVVMLAGTVD